MSKRVSQLTRKELSDLKKENQQLNRRLKQAQAENLRLRRRIDTLTTAGGKTAVAPSAMIFKRDISPAETLLSEGATARKRYGASTYAGYLLTTVKESGIGRLLRRITAFWHRLRLFRWIITLLTLVVAAALTSAVLLTLIPPLILSSDVTLLTVLFRARTVNRRMLKALEGKRIRVIIPHDSMAHEDDSFMERCAMEMSSREDVAVVVVSPYVLSVKGLGGRGLYFTVREEAPRLFLLRKGYYFIFKKSVLRRLSGSVTVMY